MTDATLSDPGHSARQRGILLICLSTALFAALDTLSKYMVGSMHPVQVTWARQFFSVLVLFLVAPPFAIGSFLRTAKPRLQLVRGILLVVVTLSFTTAIGYLPLADATTIAFTTPLIVTALASVFLKEHVGPRRWAAVAAGFVGVLIVARPDAGGVSAAAVLVLALAAANAVFLLITRMIGTSDSPQTTMILTTLVGAGLMSVAVPFFWTPATALDWVQMLAQGLLTGTAQYLVVVAYRSTSVSILAPFSYFQIVWALTLGFLVFAEAPAWSTIVGALVIVASGLYTLYREAYLRGRARG